MKKSNRIYGKHDGFTLLEVMIAIVITAIGLIGLAAMQQASLRYNNNAYLRTQATAAAWDIIERMRSNPNAVLNGSYNTQVGSPNLSGVVNLNLDAAALSHALPADPVCNPCTPTQTAAQDINDWLVHFAPPELPAGSFGTVTTSGTVHSVTISWLEGRATIRVSSLSSAESSPNKTLTLEAVF